MVVRLAHPKAVLASVALALLFVGLLLVLDNHGETVDRAMIIKNFTYSLFN
jgi:hypothetical protein